MSRNEHVVAIHAIVQKSLQELRYGLGPDFVRRMYPTYRAKAKPLLDIRDHTGDLAKQLAEAEARAGRWKRKSLAQDAYEDALLCVADGDEQERVREELRAAHNALKAHGDLDAGKGEV
jgi:hypothetical protein